jgi:hypothetical protein
MPEALPAAEVGQLVGRPEPVYRRFGHDFEIVRHHRYGERHVETIGDANRHERRRLRDVDLDGVDRCDDVFAAAAELGVVVREYRWDPAQVDAFDGVKGKALKRKSDRDPPCANGVGALGDDGPETPSGALEHAERAVELIRESA